MKRLTILLTLLATSASAQGFDRPLPQAQSATAEFWFAVASVMLIIALWAVHFLVNRK